MISFSRKQFEKICKREVEVPGITIMRDVAIAKSEFVPDQKAVTKIQTWHEDDVLWEYCCLPEVRPQSCLTFSCHEIIMLINVKMPTIVGILTFISMVNTTSVSLKARKVFIF